MNKSVDSNSNEFRSDVNEKDDPKSPDRLESEVNQARARLSRTASELSNRLSPGELVDQAIDMAREHGGEFGRNLGTQVKNNPLPMILTSVGISWMIMSSGKNRAAYASGTISTDRHSTDRHSTGTNGSSLKSALGDTLSKSKDKAAAVGDSLHNTSADMKESAQNIGESLVHFYRDQPLLAGSLGIAIGAALGALIPSTEFEDDTFGEISDRSLETAKTEAMNKYDEVRNSARPQ